jgi:hypothetical protein
MIANAALRIHEYFGGCLPTSPESWIAPRQFGLQAHSHSVDVRRLNVNIA